ncbi:hypothetical protein [Shouchella lehensis]|uniref:Uncharacterized protein n=1 Tax=Shouchella lehensis G1 TaxID=1246626 RepID=A0A060M4C3_9BACI|nr:hypothetical protein [Shouchella lehensis]AIC95398.1 hypothetical protein BleG1_2834 [Shouchella lehensis G1]
MILDMNDSYTQCQVINILDNQSKEAETKARISFILKPKLTIDGNQWCALYGDSLADGVVGFGDTPDEAYANFDKNWYQKL